MRVNGTELVEGDGVAIEGEPKLAVEGVQPAEFLLLDLA